MTRTRIYVQWGNQAPVQRFHSGVSLHSHTHHSRESLAFIYRIAAHVGFIDSAIRVGQRRCGLGFDLARGWWTPPLIPHAAWEVESRQIEAALGLKALVSLTDHDTLEGPMSLRLVHTMQDIPLSVEWTVPFGETFFHLGIHNLPPSCAHEAMQAMEGYTKTPREEALAGILEWFQEIPEILVVLNHPLWDEKEIGPRRHRKALKNFLHRHEKRIHAFEVNGLRPWRENSWVLEMGRVWDKPVVAGGDRHGMEANTVLNLSYARSFAEFAEDIRVSRRSDILITSAYRRPIFWRFFDTVLEVVGDYEAHGLGWTRWDDRVFYLCEDGLARSLRQIWRDRPPGLVHSFTFLARMLHRSWLQRTLRAAAFLQEEWAW